jgi:hypothetical protein
MRALYRFLILLLCTFCAHYSYSQGTSELEKDGNSHFEKGEFVEATPYYLRLIYQDPKN